MEEIEGLEVAGVLHGVVYCLAQLVPAGLVLEQYKDLFGIAAHVDQIPAQLDDCKGTLARIEAGRDVELLTLAHHRLLVTFDDVPGQVADLPGKGDLEELRLGGVLIRPDE